MRSLTAIMMLLMPLYSLGQYQLGFKAGYDYYWFTSPDDGHYSATYDFNHSAPAAGLSFRTNSSNPLNIGIEVNYNYKSFRVNSRQGGLGGGTYYHYHYQIGNLGLRFQALFGFGKKVRFYFYPGFFFATQVHSSFNGTRYSWWMDKPPFYDTLSGSANPYYPNMVFGFCAGTGISYPLSPDLSIVLECSYNYTLTPVADAWGSDKVKIMDLLFELGIYYQIKRKEQ